MSSPLTPAPYYRIKLENKSKHCSNNKINVKTKLSMLPIKEKRIHNISFNKSRAINLFIEMLLYRFYHLPIRRVTFVIPQKSDLVWVLWILYIWFLTTQIRNPKLQSDYPLFPLSKSAPRQGSVTVTGAYHSHTSQCSCFQQACCTMWHQRPMSSSLFQVSFRGKEAASSTCQSTRSNQPGSNTQTWLRAFGHFEKLTGIIMEQQQLEK